MRRSTSSNATVAVSSTESRGGTCFKNSAAATASYSDQRLADQTAIFRCDDKQRVTLLLSLLGREMEVRLPANAVRAYG